jgi:serine/threonine protein kinase
MGCSSSTTTNVVTVHSQYQFARKLGQGSFGQVRMAINRSTHKECAVKIGFAVTLVKQKAGETSGAFQAGAGNLDQDWLSSSRRWIDGNISRCALLLLCHGEM